MTSADQPCNFWWRVFRKLKTIVHDVRMMLFEVLKYILIFLQRNRDSNDILNLKTNEISLAQSRDCYFDTGYVDLHVITLINGLKSGFHGSASLIDELETNSIVKVVNPIVFLAYVGYHTSIYMQFIHVLLGYLYHCPIIPLSHPKFKM